MQDAANCGKNDAPFAPYTHTVYCHRYTPKEPSVSVEQFPPQGRGWAIRAEMERAGGPPARRCHSRISNYLGLNSILGQSRPLPLKGVFLFPGSYAKKMLRLSSLQPVNITPSDINCALPVQLSNMKFSGLLVSTFLILATVISATIFLPSSWKNTRDHPDLL